VSTASAGPSGAWGGGSGGHEHHSWNSAQAGGGGGSPGQSGQSGQSGQGGGGSPHYHQTWNGQGEGQRGGGGGEPGQPGGQWSGRFEAGHGVPSGEENRAWSGHGGAPGFMPGNHPFRPQDHGRQWYNAGVFPHQFYAQHRYHGWEYHEPHGWFFRNWVFGEYLPWGWYAPDYYIDYYDYSLPPPPIGCEWVRVGDDALLVDVWTGEVLSVYHNLFW
jgi:Ni/Co efflux regulator RcnB